MVGRLAGDFLQRYRRYSKFLVCSGHLSGALNRLRILEISKWKGDFMKKVLLLFVFSFLLCSSAQAGESLVITAAPSVYAQPEGDHLAGPAVDLITMIFQEFGIAVETKIVPWVRAVEEVKTGEVDAILTLFFTKERAEFIDYLPHYCEVQAVVIVPKGNLFPYSKWEDLIGKKGMMVKEDSQGEAFDAFAKEKLNIQRVTALQDMIRVLALSRRVDYGIYTKEDCLVAARKLNVLDKIEILPTPLTSELLFIGFSKKSGFREYIPQVNNRIIELRLNGTIDKMIRESILNSTR